MKPYLSEKGYYLTGLCRGKKVINLRVHRLVAKTFIPNTENKNQVDHIDNNKTNNDVNNLRWATNQKNSRNKGIGKTNTTGINRVGWYEKYKKWRAYVDIDVIKIHLGYFDSKEEAQEKRISAVNGAFGEFKNKCENN